MHVTLEDFFNNYRIKNQHQPNETVLNRGLIRLKREIRELKSIIDIIIGGALATWNPGKIYELDEYVESAGLIYKSSSDQNFNNTPSLNSNNWQLVTIDTVATSKGTVFKHQVYTATDNQTVFVTPFLLENAPMVFIDGLLLTSDKFTVTNNSTVTLNNQSKSGDIVTIVAGVTYDSSLVLAKQNFISTQNQYIFNTDFVLKSPSVFVNGLLIDNTAFTWYDKILEFVTPLIADQNVVICNGSIIGSDIYTQAQIDDKLNLKLDITDSYSQTEIDNLLSPLSTISYVDGKHQVLDTSKADKSNTLSGYGIADAYTKAEIDNKQALKLDASTYTPSDILSKLLSVDGDGSGLDSDTLSGVSSSKYARTDVERPILANNRFVHASNKNEYLSDPETVQLLQLNEIYLDADASQSIQGNPGIYIRKYDVNNQLISDNEVYHEGNTSSMIVIKEGYFKGTWEPTLDNTFGITSYADYNWVIVVTPTVTGTEHDYNKDSQNGHTPYIGFDNNITWDSNQSEYHYGYINGSVVVMQAIHRNGSTVIDLPARYQLIGIKKSFSTHEWVNQP